MPYKTDGTREYRSFTLSVRDAADEKNAYMVEGYATTFNEPYELFDDYFEQIDARALDTADMSDVIFQLNHEGAPMARQSNGSLSISTDEHGIYVKAKLDGSKAGRELYEMISNGLITKMSWGFTIADDGWHFDEQTRTATISRVKKVYDVSAVSIPANDNTEIKARSYLNGVIEKELEEYKQRELDRRKRLALALEMEG